MPDVTLRTVVLPEAHIGENIKAAVCEMVEMFGLQDKHIVYVTNQGSNVVKACRLAGVEMVDGLGKCQKAHRMLDKVKDIIKMFTYKIAMLEKEAQVMINEAAARCLSDVYQEINTDCMISMPASDDDETQEAKYVTATMQTASTEPQSVHSATSLKKVLSDMVEHYSNYAGQFS